MAGTARAFRAAGPGVSVTAAAGWALGVAPGIVVAVAMAGAAMDGEPAFALAVGVLATSVPREPMAISEAAGVAFADAPALAASVDVGGTVVAIAWLIAAGGAVVPREVTDAAWQLRSIRPGIRPRKARRPKA